MSGCDGRGARPERADLVPKSSGEDARLSTAIGEFDPRRDRHGEACAKGASCTCNAAAAGSIPVLSTICMAVMVTAARHARLVCERARFDPE
jgi:hypothetical protein